MDDGIEAALFAFVLGLPLILLSAFFGSFTAAFAVFVLVGGLALSFVIASRIAGPGETADATAEAAAQRATDRRDDEADALDTLRERYARGELSEAEFERKTERLLRTETVEDAAERVTDDQPGRGRNPDREPDRNRNLERERDR